MATKATMNGVFLKFILVVTIALALAKACPEGQFESSFLDQCLVCPENAKTSCKDLGPDADACNQSCVNVPSEVTNISLVPVSHTQLRISWETPPDQNSNINGYYITWRIVRNDTNHTVDGELKTVKVEKSTKSFDISNLEAYSEYIVTVNAIDGAGNGPNVTKRARTREYAPSAPTNVEVIAGSSSQVNVTWQPPSEPNGVITGYGIIWKTITDDLNNPGNNVLNSIPLDASARMYSIKNLKPYSEYNVSVNAVTNGGNGSFESKVVRTKQSTPGEPSSVRVRPSSPSELNLTWVSPSDPNGEICGYRVTWRLSRDSNNMTVTNNDSKTQIINDGDATSFQIDKLEPYSEYKISLNAMTRIGNGSIVTLTSRTKQSKDPSVSTSTGINPMIWIAIIVGLVVVFFFGLAWFGSRKRVNRGNECRVLRLPTEHVHIEMEATRGQAENAGDNQPVLPPPPPPLPQPVEDRQYLGSEAPYDLNKDNQGTL